MSQFPHVVAPDKLVYVAVQVLGTEAVERALVRPFEDGPEALDSVGVNLAPDILPDRVLD